MSGCHEGEDATAHLAETNVAFASSHHSYRITILLSL